MVRGGRLEIEIRFDTACFSREEIQALSGHYHQTLTDLIRHCMAQEGPALTPSDLGYKGLSLEEYQDFFE